MGDILKKKMQEIKNLNKYCKFKSRSPVKFQKLSISRLLHQVDKTDKSLAFNDHHLILTNRNINQNLPACSKGLRETLQLWAEMLPESSAFFVGLMHSNSSNRHIVQNFLPNVTGKVKMKLPYLWLAHLSKSAHLLAFAIINFNQKTYSCKKM